MPAIPITQAQATRVRAVRWAHRYLGGDDLVLLQLWQMYDALHSVGHKVYGADLVHWYIGAAVDLWDQTESGVVLA